MIIRNFDIGWGPEWPMKQLEQQIVNNFLSQYHTDNSRSVIINSVWYTGDYHREVMTELRELKPTHIFVVALLDPPIIQLDWFQELNCEVLGIGYYPGPGQMDYFSLFFDHFYKPIDQTILLSSESMDTAYMCLNRKPHPHRLRIYRGLENAGLLDQGFVSMGGDTTPMRSLEQDASGQEFAPNGGSDQYGIANDIATLGNLDNWRRHFLNIVTETIWDIEPSNFVSEKTYKPILGLRPFLIYAPNGGVKCLESRGFESYVNDFNDITDIDLTQPYNVVNFVKILCQQKQNYWSMKFDQLIEKLLFNQQRFKQYVVEQQSQK